MGIQRQVNARFPISLCRIPEAMIRLHSPPLGGQRQAREVGGPDEPRIRSELRA
jgi:hypothetical protein